MDFAFDESQTAVRELARGLFSKLHLATNLDLPAVWRELGRANLLGVGLPVAVGGSDSGFVALCCVLEQAGEVASPLPLLPALVFAGLPLARTGAAPATLAALCQGERVLCASYGTRGEPALRARREGETWVVSGSETCVEGAPLADQLLLAARGEAGPRMLFLVDRSTSGLTIEPQSVASGHSLGRIQLQDVRLSGAALVGDPGQADALIDWTLERAYVAQCAYELGLGGKALAMTARFAGERQQFGRPIGTFQAVAQRIADAHIAVETMRLTLWRAAWLVEQGVDARREIAVARTIATQAGHEVVCAAQHIHGSMGFDRDYPLYRYFLASKQNELLFGGHNFHLARLGKLLSCD